MFNLKSILTLGLMCMVIQCSAQWIFNGIVQDSSGVPLEGANVQLAKTTRFSVTDPFGRFSFADLDQDHYVIRISFIGFETLEQKIDSSASSLVFILKPQVMETREVEISALRADEETPMSFTNIDKEDLEKMNTGKDIPVLLESVPSLVSFSDAGAGIGYTGMRIRGSDVTRINVTMNGIPVNDAESQGVFWVNMPDLATSLSSLQVQRGVGTSTNGSGAFGASINLETEKAVASPFGEVQLSAGSFNTQRYTAAAGTGLIKNRWWMETRLSQITSDGYLQRASSDLRSFYLSGGYVSEKTSIKAVVFRGKQSTYQAWNGVDSITFADDPAFNSSGAIYDENGEIIRYYDNETDNYQQDHYQLHWNQSISEYWRLNLSLHYTYGKGYYEQYRQGETLADYNIFPVVTGADTVFTTDLIRRLWLDNDFYGSTFNLERNKGALKMIFGGGIHQYDGRHYGDLVWARFAGNSELNDRFYENESNKLDMNGYLKTYFEVNTDLTAFLDLQVRSVNYSGFGMDRDFVPVDFDLDYLFFNPKAGLTYKLNNRQRIYFSYAISNREPNRNDITDNGGEIPLPERLQNVEIGYGLQTEKWEVNANLYGMYYTNQLVLTGEINNVGAFIRENVGESYRTGLEIQASWAMMSRLSWHPVLSLSKNVNVNYFEEDEEGVETLGNTPIAFSPEIIGASEFRWKVLDNLSLSWTLRYVGEQYLSNNGNTRNMLDDYLVSDARIEYLIPWKEVDSFRVFLHGYNIFNAHYASNGYVYGTDSYFYPQAGFNFLTGLALRF